MYAECTDERVQSPVPHSYLGFPLWWPGNEAKGRSRPFYVPKCCRRRILSYASPVSLVVLLAYPFLLLLLWRWLLSQMENWPGIDSTRCDFKVLPPSLVTFSDSIYPVLQDNYAIHPPPPDFPTLSKLKAKTELTSLCLIFNAIIGKFTTTFLLSIHRIFFRPTDLLGGDPAAPLCCHYQTGGGECPRHTHILSFGNTVALNSFLPKFSFIYVVFIL